MSKLSSFFRIEKKKSILHIWAYGLYVIDFTSSLLAFWDP